MFIVAISLILSVFVGMLAISIVSALLLWTGRWLGGEGSFQHIRAAVAWSNIPNVGVILMWIVLMSTFGGSVFLSDFYMIPMEGNWTTLLKAICTIKVIFWAWGLILLLCTLSEVQKFSIGKAVLNVAIPSVIVAVVGWLLSVMVMGTSLPS